jgi:hypothetical protein
MPKNFHISDIFMTFILSYVKLHFCFDETLFIRLGKKKRMRKINR